MIEELIYRSSIENFDQVKSTLLNSIESMGKFSFIDQNQHISNSDWHLGPNFPRPYIDLAIPHINKFNEELIKHFSYETIDIINIWYQQYEIGDHHPIHTHGAVSFSNVMFLELPSEKISTKFYFRNKQYSVDGISEGDIIGFPGIIHHESPINNSGRKTSIVWNTAIT